MQRKFHGFSYISSNLNTLPLITTDSCFPASWTRESFCGTTLQFFSLSDSNDTTSDISYADLGPDKVTICWLIGVWPRFRVDLAKQILVLLALSATVHGAWIEVSLEVVWKGTSTRFPHPRDVWWVKVVRVSTPRARRYAYFPVPWSMRCCLYTTLLKGWMLCFCVITHYSTDILMLLD